MPSIQDYLKQYEDARRADMPSSEGKIDFSAMSLQPAPTPVAQQEGKWSDLAVTGAKGVIGAGEALVGLANLPTFGYAGKALEGVGYRPAEAKAALDQMYSPYRQEVNKGLAETKGFLPTLGYMVDNPSTIGHAIVESIPSTLGGGAIAQGVRKLAPKAGTAVAAGIGEGLVSGGSTAESIRQETEDRTLSAGQVAASLTSGALNGLIGGKSGAFATKLGLPDVDIALAGGAGAALKPGYLKRVGTAALVEGVLEELPQSAQEQVFRNAALGKPLSEGVAEAAAQGMLVGIGMGGGFAATRIRQTPAGQVTPDDLKSAVDEQLLPTGEPADVDLFGQGGTPVQTELPSARQAEPEGIAPATDLSVTPQMFDEQGRVNPEVPQAERLARRVPRTDDAEVMARLQAAQQTAPQGQAALMAGQMPAPSPIVLAQGGTPVQIPETALKGLPIAAKAELRKQLGDPRAMAAAVADMFYTKASAGSSAAYVFDKLPVLYQQLTGQPLPETPPQSPDVRQTAIGSQGADFLQGETPAQAAANYARAQELAAVETPLPDVTVPKGQASFLTAEGDVDTVQKGLSRKESAAQTRARKYAAQQKAARQKMADTMLGQNIPEAPVAEQQLAEVADSQTKGNRDGAATQMVEPRREGAGGNATTSAGVGRTAGAGSERGVRGRAGAPAGGDLAPVAVGGTGSERVTAVAEAPAQKESPYAKKKERESELREYVSAYEELKKPADMPLSKFKKQRVAYLTSIAEVEANADTNTTKVAASRYLETIPDKDEVAQARRAAASRVKNLSELEAVFKAQNDAVAKLIAEQDAQLAEYESPTKRKKSQADKTLEKQFKQMDESGATQGVTAPGFHTQTSLAVELAKTFGQKFMAALKSGRVVILPNQLHLAAMTGRPEHRSQMNQGLYVYNTSDRSNGVVYFVAGNISQSVQGFRAVDIALHEIGEHAGMQHMLGKQNYMNLLVRIQTAMLRNGTGTTARNMFDKDVATAQKRLLPSQQGNAREVLAYMIQHTPDANILTKMWSQLKAWLIKRGWVSADKADAQVLRALAEGATRKWLSDIGAKDVPAELKPGATTVDFSGVTSPTTLKTLTDYKTATDAAKSLLDKVTKTKSADMTLSAFKTVIPWLTKQHLISRFDKWLGGGLAMNGKADSIQETMTTRMNQLFNEPYQRFLALEREDKERAKKITELMQATEFQIDPRKAWDKHTHLHDLTGWELEQAKKFIAQYGQIWGKMPKGDRQLYNDLAQMNETMYTAELALSLYNMVRANPGAKDIAEFQADPSEKFRESTTVHGSIEAAQQYWRGVLDRYSGTVEQYVSQQRGLLPTKQESDPEYQAAVKAALRGIQSKKARQLVRRALRTKEDKSLSDAEKKIVRHLSPLEAQMRMVNETVATFAHAPYFHLGRFGDHFVSFRVRTGEDNLADPAAMEQVQRELATAFPKITIRSDATDPHVFARFESVGEQQEFVRVIRKMQEQGWLMQPGVKDEKNKDLGEIVAGSRNEVISGYHTAGPNWLSRVVESIQAADFDDATADRMIAHVRSLYLDSLPDSAAIKVKQKREGRPGWDADMMRSYAHRMRIGSNRVGSLAAEPIRTQSFAVMKDAQARAQTDPNAIGQVGQIAAVVSEFERRNSDQMSVPNTPAIDKLRALNHAYFLGMSPSYVLIQMTQLGVLTWPELAKKNGFVKSAKAIAEVTPIALKVMRTVIEEGYKQRGVKGAADMVVTSEMMEKAGVSQADTEFLMKVMAAGKIDIGNAAREIGRVAEGETGSQALKIASSLGYASETVTRLTTALASKRMYDAKPAGQKPATDPVKYAIGVIDESMLNYTTTNIGRMTGKQGVVGTWTPVMFSFLQYQFQLLEKMYREFYTAFTSKEGMTKAEKDEARRFLAGHMFSMLTLAGTLGLPFATAIAAAADKMCGLFSGEYCDSKTSLRNMTADVFGYDIEPLVSKGLLSRALGFDISERAGEGNLLPFSKFLADKRKMEDALKDLAWSSWGAPSSMIAGIYKGYERMADGDLVGGMQEAVPMALKGPVKAFEMSEKGYTDKAGNVLPMTPGAYDIMLQTLGLNPGEKADYQAAKFAQSQRKAVLTREGTVIRQKLASAIERGDETAMRDWAGKAQEYDAKNPERAILANMSATLQQRARARAQALSTGTPLGVSPKDHTAQQFTSFYRGQ